jgi:hypothetical protein
MERLRFALLFNGRSLERWHLRCLDHLEESALLVGVILATDNPDSSAQPADSFLIRLCAPSVGNAETVDVTERLANMKRFCRADEDEPVESGDLDFVLKLGRGSIPAGMKVATRHGVWCFQHETQEGLLPFFREVYDGEDVTEAALLSLGGARGDAAILEQGHFRTEKRSYFESRDKVLEGIVEWPARVCRRLANETGGPALSSARTPRPSHHSFRPQLVRLWARIACRRISFALARVFRHPQWNIGVLPLPVETLLRPESYHDRSIEWFPLDGRLRFFADPFGVVRDGAIHVLCECFEYSSGKGHISALQYSHHGFTSPPEPAIELPVHMSYPFLVEDAGQIYCIPETCAANEVALFRAVEFPRRWSKVAVLIENFGALDPTVFRHGGFWWLFCTQKGRYADTGLWVWYASDLFGPWTAHAGNPVKTDVRSARPGGVPFVHEGILYRPAQDCSKNYGSRIVIQRVRSLTPTEFVEETVTVLEPSQESPFPLGRHTLTPVGDMVLIDGHRAVFVWYSFRSFLKTWARDIWNKFSVRWRSTRPDPGEGRSV